MSGPDAATVGDETAGTARMLAALDAFMKAYEVLKHHEVAGGSAGYQGTAGPLAGETERIARLEAKIDTIALWVRSIDRRFAALIDLVAGGGIADREAPPPAGPAGAGGLADVTPGA